MERILLYYPAINIPNGVWLRNSILYTDKVSSIFPFENINDNGVEDETKYLYDEGQYQPIFIKKALTEAEDSKDKNLHEFEYKFIKTIKSEKFKQMQNKFNQNNRKWDWNSYILYSGKITQDISEVLSRMNLLSDFRSEESRMEKTTAILYLSMIANYLANNNNNNLVIPSTDQKEYEKIAFQLYPENTISSFKLILENCLPTPTPHTSLKKIINFKKKETRTIAI